MKAISVAVASLIGYVHSINFKASLEIAQASEV